MNWRRGSTTSPISIEKMLVGRGGVLDADLRERARRGVHRRVAQLLGVHLAEALEALERDALLRDVQHRLAQRLERRARPRCASPSVTVNGGVPASSTSCAVDADELRYSCDSNSAARDPVRRARPVLRLDRADT